jgi:hypothetical protein
VRVASRDGKGRYEHRDSILGGEEKRRQSIADMTNNTSGESVHDPVHLLKFCCRLTDNRIKNPLVGIPKADLFRDVEEYAHEHGLTENLDLLKKGALVAQNPTTFDEIEELDAADVEALRTENTNRWKHPKTLYFTIAINSIGAAIQGWDQTGSNGANLSFPQEFNIADTGASCTAAGTCERNSWIIGAINAAPYMAIALL